jgi:16S rRNA (guanine1516-N2)-methyltransferase
VNDWTPPHIVGFREVWPDGQPGQTGQIELSELPGQTESSVQQDVFRELAIPVVQTFPESAWVLLQRGPILELARPDGVRLSLDFTSGKTRYRTTESGKGIQPLARALGLSAYRRQHQAMPLIIDATGGLGQDAWALASLGCRLSVIEQHPVVHALLANALQRAAVCPVTRTIADAVSLLKSSAEVCLPALCANGDVHAIYLDPMYPERPRKKAESRKGMQFLHALLGPLDDAMGQSLLKAALQCPVNRVVVKRPRGAARLDETGQLNPMTCQVTCIESPGTRHDVYHLQY